MKRAVAKPTARALRARELALIHIGAASLGLIDGPDDSAYRRMLQTVARVDSAAKLDHAGREAVLRHLRACGFQPVRRGRVARPPAAARSRSYRPGTQPALMRHLWTCLHEAGAVRDPSDAALRRWAERQSKIDHEDGVGYSSLEFMPTKAAQAVIERLKNWCSRLEVKWE